MRKRAREKTPEEPSWRGEGHEEEEEEEEDEYG